MLSVEIFHLSSLITSFLLTIFLTVNPTSAVQYGNNTVPVKRDPNTISPDVFADPEHPLYSPAFIDGYDNPSGFAQGIAPPVDEQSLEYFMVSFAQNNKHASFHELKATSEEGRPLRYIVLSRDPCLAYELFNQQSKSTHESHCSKKNQEKMQKVRIWLQGGVHGNEPAGGESLLAFMGELSKNTSYADYLLDKVDIVLLPRYNPDGNYYFQRRLASNYDPNRDHLRLISPQTVSIKQLFNAFNCHVALDQHEFTVSSRATNTSVEVYDGMYSTAKNLNIDSTIRNFAEEIFVGAMRKSLDNNGFRGFPYFNPEKSQNNRLLFRENPSDARIGNNAYGLTQSFSFFTETRGLGIADEHYKRRTATGLVLLKAIVNTAREHADEVYHLVEDARKNLSNGKIEDEIVVTDSPIRKSIPYQLIDSANGSFYEITVDWDSFSPSVANLTRPRPKAYIIPPAWRIVAENLQHLGVKVEKLDYKFSGLAETLRIETSHVSRSHAQGYFPHTVTTSTHKRPVTLPSGSYYVSTSQQNVALAFLVLEPEASESYVSNDIIPVFKGDEYYIFRIPKDG